MATTHLTYNHFQSPGGKILKIKIPGIVFVMFKQINCGHCQSFMPEFEAMSRQEQRVKFCYAEVTGENRKIATMSQTTNTPIKLVPMFILYVNGSPMFKYNGIHERSRMLAFLNKVIMDMRGSGVPSNFVNQQRAPVERRQEQPSNLGRSREDLEKNKKLETPNTGFLPYNAPYMYLDKYKNLDTY